MQQFGWPESIRRGITLALVVGLFVTHVLAWYHGEQRVSGTELVILSLLLAVGGGLLWRFAASEKNPSCRCVVMSKVESACPIAA